MTTTGPERRGIPFSVPTLLGPEPEAAAAAIAAGFVGSGGPHTRRAEHLIAQRTGRRALLTSSCTDALLLAMMALEIGDGDEVIVPSYTFVSTALVVAVRGATPVFADVEPRTLTLDPASVARHVSPRTRAILTMHYGGGTGDLAALVSLAQTHGVPLVEDVAHAYGGAYRGRTLGTHGAMGALSFGSLKNVQCGEGGAVLVDEPELVERLMVLREKGTNRQAFLDGHIDKYTWVGLGGNHLPADYVAAALAPQLLGYDTIQERRARQWRRYRGDLAGWAARYGVDLPEERDEIEHTHHIFWLVLPDAEQRRSFTAWMAAAGIPTPFHYPSLARTPAGLRYGRTHGTPVSDEVAERLVRLPLHHALTDDELTRVVERATAWRPEQLEVP